MSDITAISMLLAVFALGTISVSSLLRHMYKRSDDLLSGSVNGEPVQSKTRWLFLIYDYLPLSFGVTLVLGVLATGFVAAIPVVGENAKVVAFGCSLISGGFFFFNLCFGIGWMVHFVSVLRQAEAD